jgi:hypothetical protein
MDVKEAALYEDFQQARVGALEVTDRYRDVPSGDPRKDDLWRGVVTHTAVAQDLLKRWLDEVDAPEPALCRGYPNRPLTLSSVRRSAGFIKIPQAGPSSTRRPTQLS